MWLVLALAAALFQVLRNTAMKRLGHALDEYINVWGRFTFLLPFAFVACVLSGWPTLKPGFFGWCLAFGVSQTLSTLALSKALKLSEISLVTALWKVSLLILLAMGVVVGEWPSPLGVAGVLLSAAGVYLLNVKTARISLLAPLRVLVTDRGHHQRDVARRGESLALGLRLDGVVEDPEVQVEPGRPVPFVDQHVPERQRVLAAGDGDQHELVLGEHPVLPDGLADLIAEELEEVRRAECGVVTPQLEHGGLTALAALHRGSF